MDRHKVKCTSYIDVLDKFLKGVGNVRHDGKNNPHNASFSEVVDDCYNKLVKCNTKCTLQSSDIEKLQKLQVVIETALKSVPKSNPEKTLPDVEKINQSSIGISSVVVCPCCFSSVHSDLKALYFHIKDMCEVVRSENYLPPNGYTTYQIAFRSIKCNLCKVEVPSYREKMNHEISPIHLKNKGKNNGKPILFCSSCRQFVPDSERQYGNHIRTKSHLLLENNPRRAMMNRNIAFLMYSSEIKCLLCNKSVKLAESNDHIKEQGHSLNVSKNIGCASVWCFSCNYMMLPNDILLHAISTDHIRYAKQESVCLFCEKLVPQEGCEIVDHYKKSCLEIKALDDRRRNLTSGGSKEFERPSFKHAEQVKSTNPSNTAKKVVLIKDLKNATKSKVEISLLLEEEFNGLIDDITAINEDVLKVSFKDAGAAEKLMTTQRIPGLRLNVVPYNSTE